MHESSGIRGEKQRRIRDVRGLGDVAIVSHSQRCHKPPQFLGCRIGSRVRIHCRLRGPGAEAIDIDPVRSVLDREARVSPMTAAFAARYVASPDTPTWPKFEDNVMIFPYREGTKCFSACWAHRNVPRTFTARC